MKTETFHNAIGTTNEDTFYGWYNAVDKKVWKAAHIEMDNQTLYIIHRPKQNKLLTFLSKIF